jgi:predicted MFS family arabinose efflux permease
LPDTPHRAVPSLAIAALSFAAFAGAAGTRMGDPLLPRLDADFGIGLGSAAQIVTAFSIAYGLLQVFYGPVGDRYGKYRVVAFACIASAGSSLFCALAPTFKMLVVARFIAGGTAAAVIPLSMAWIGDVVPYERRQPVLARFLTGQIFGFAGGQLIGGIAAQYWGWRLPFFVLTGWFAVAAVMLLYMDRRLPELPLAAKTQSRSAVHRLLADFQYVLRHRWARVIVVTVFLEGAAMFGPIAFLASHLHIEYGKPLSVAGGALVLYAVGGLAFAVSAPLLVRRLGEVGLAAGGGTVLCIAFTLIGLASWWPIAVGALLLAGLGFYMLHNTLQINATQMAPERRGASVALFACSLFLGQAAGVALAGMWVQRLTTSPVIVTGAVCLLAIGLVFSRLCAAHQALDQRSGLS